MFRSIIKPVLLASVMALKVAALSDAQDTPALDTNFDPSIHDVSLVPRLHGSAPVTDAENSKLRVSEHAQHYANQRPTIIVRPSVGCSGCLNECELAIEPISSIVEDRFRLKLSIPESIEIVELFPRQPGEQTKKVRVSLEPSTETADSFTSVQEECRADRESLQLVSGDMVKSKFMANPFFADHLSGARNNTGQVKTDNDFVPSPFHLSSAKVKEFSQETSEEPTASKQLSLQANLIGPRSLEAGASAEFEINVLNPSSTDYRNVLVQLQLPDGLEPLLLDRTAWLDATRRTVSWKVDELKSGQLEAIHYAVLTTTAGPQLQKITVGIDGLNRGDAEIRTLVTSPFEIPEKFEPADNALQDFRE